MLIKIAVEWVSIDNSTTSGPDDEAMAYVRAICNFRHLVLSDEDRILSYVVRSLTDAYGCRSVHPVTSGRSRTRAAAAAEFDFDNSNSEECSDDDHRSILLELRQPRDQMLTLQVDLSSGHLGRELPRRIVTKNLTKRLGLTELNLTTDIRSIE